MRQYPTFGEFVPKVFVPTRQWMPSTQPVLSQASVTEAPAFPDFGLEVERQPKHEPAQKKSESYVFPEGGWVCSKCDNYNFKNKKICHRCKKAKSSEDVDGKPEHMSAAASEKAIAKANNRKKKLQKKYAERVEEKADSVCQQCFNHSYSCICHMSQADTQRQQ